MSEVWEIRFDMDGGPALITFTDGGEKFVPLSELVNRWEQLPLWDEGPDCD